MIDEENEPHIDKYYALLCASRFDDFLKKTPSFMYLFTCPFATKDHVK